MSRPFFSYLRFTLLEYLMVDEFSGSVLTKIDTAPVRLDGVREADSLIPMEEHPNRQAITKAVPGATHAAGRLPFTLAEAAMAQNALSAAQRVFDASPAGITQRLRHAVWAKATAEGVE
jgi:hypothetical protein